MTLQEAILARHSVRSYQDRPLTSGDVIALRTELGICNAQSGLHLQLVVEEPKAFTSGMARYGKFSGVTNYIALVGPDTRDLDEKLGYWGEKVVIYAQMMGLNTCWVGLTFSKTPGAFEVSKGEKLRGVISIGFGQTQGVGHKSKEPSDVAEFNGVEPEWFREGVKFALLAPTAVNQQKFKLSWKGGNRVSAKADPGFFSHMDLGIVKYHFEIGAGQDIEWV